jgi:FlaG/FlaF family flagellin (archaellin)
VSPVVGVVVLVGVTVTLAAVAGTTVAFGYASVEPAPQATFTATANATDGWPEGQHLRVVHRGGDAVAVAEVAVVVTIPRVDAHARLSGFPTRRLTDDNVRGRDVFDNGYAGVDGALDAAHTDGAWTAGESTSIRVAQGDLDLRPGDRVRIRVVHRPSNAVLARLAVRATEY